MLERPVSYRIQFQNKHQLAQISKKYISQDSGITSNGKLHQTRDVPSQVHSPKKEKKLNLNRIRKKNKAV